MINKEKYIRFNGTFPLELNAQLKEMAQLNERSLNFIVNRILREYCETHTEIPEINKLNIKK